jgi:predicted component of type VI protein secretion system
MRLTLTLQGPGRLMGATRSRSLTTGSLLIGRSPVCDWVLPDPERVVSGRHCRIDSEIDRFMLTDLSTNGTFLDEASEPLGFGGKVALRDGQTLRLGDARVRVQLLAPAAARPAEPLAEPGSTLIADDWFAPAGTGGESAGPPLADDFDALLTRALAEAPRADGPVQPQSERADAASLASLCVGLSGLDVLAAFEDALSDFDPESAANLLRAFVARLQGLPGASSLTEPRSADEA